MTSIIKKTIITAILLTASVTMGARTLGIAGEEHSSVGIYIEDLKADTVVFSVDADRNLVPASVTKLVTSAAALNILGPGYRFSTDVDLVGSPTVSDGVFRGDLVITGHGDPTLESENFDDNQGFCDSVAACLKRMGITRITGKVRTVDRMQQAGPVEQWEIDDVAWAYGAGVFGLNYRDNIFTLTPSDKKTRPHIPQLEVVTRRSASGTNLVRGIWSDRLYVFGTNPTSRKFAVTSTMADPAAALAYALEQTLAENGIGVDGRQASGTESRHLYTHFSPELSRILRSLMLRSDNMYAEATLRAFVPEGTRQDCLEAERKALRQLGADTRYVTIKDGSGLSRVNRISPAFLATVLKQMVKESDGGLFTTFFPRAGREGTMRSFLKGTVFEGRLALKTGSMNGVQSYAGYLLDQDGNPTHVVVIMVNSFYCSRPELRKAIQTMLHDKLAGYADEMQ